MIKRISILGAGLLGGSIALRVKSQLPEVEVALWARRQQPLDIAKSLGISEVSTDLASIVKDADLIILATPVGVMGDMVEQIIAARADEEFLITDVGSVKRLPHELIDSLLVDRKAHFIGSHPMAGSEKAGMEAAREDLVDGAACIITGEHPEKVELLSAFWKSLGCRTRHMTAEDHDYAVARVSHFPHLLASMGATVGLEYPDIGELAGGGLKDTTRVASGDPELWSEILLENRDAIQRTIAESISELAKIQEMLRINDEPEMLKYLIEAKKRRDQI